LPERRGRGPHHRRQPALGPRSPGHRSQPDPHAGGLVAIASLHPGRSAVAGITLGADPGSPWTAWPPSASPRASARGRGHARPCRPRAPPEIPASGTSGIARAALAAVVSKDGLTHGFEL
jgi:hypothetical protein